MPRLRATMALMGALAGASLFLMLSAGHQGLLSDHAALAATVLVGVFFTALLTLTGPLGGLRAAERAAVQALGVAGLVAWASFRFDPAMGLLSSPIAVTAGLVLVLIPLPFVLAEEAASWRDYPALFAAAWGMVMRTTVAWLFVALLWAVIFLCQALLNLVGIDAIAQVLQVPAAPWLITGTGFGLAMAVALELADVVSAFLVLRLLRLLVPVVLAVLVVFLLAVVLRGTSVLLAGFSIGSVLLLMAGVAATLVTAAVDQTDAEATASLWMQRATQALAVLLILPAGLAGWAIALRVAAHGWTPDRLFAATVAAQGLGYGAAYLVAVLRGQGWRERIRRANIAMALVLMALSVLWLTPLLNPERIAADSQMARLRGGLTKPADIDLAAFGDWGRAGAAARAQLTELAKSDADLARALAPTGAAPPPPGPQAVEALRAALRLALPVQPRAAAAFRDQALALADADLLQGWQQACATILPQGGPGCVMVVGDFLPESPGPEAMVILDPPDGYLTYLGLAIQDGALQRLNVDSATGALANFADGERLIAALQAQAPDLRPIARQELAAPFGGALSLKP